MFDLFTAIFASVGLAVIITESFILESLRERLFEISDKLGYLFKCPMCMSVWTGAFVAIFYNLDPFKVAMIASLCSFIIMSCINTLNYLSDFLFSKTEEVDQEDDEA